MILLTGGTGFVGRNLVKELLARSFKVRCLARDPAKASFLEKQGCEIARGNINDKASLKDALTPDIHTVIHLVGILTETKGSTFESVHVEGTANVLEAASLRGVKRYLHISALGTRQNARSRYHKTKWEAEEMIRASGLDYTIFRPSVIFGREDRFTNVFASMMRRFSVMPVPGSGRNRMQPIYVKDLARAMAESLSMHEARKKVYEMGGQSMYTLDEILDLIAGVIGRKVRKVHIPMALMRMNAAIAEALLPVPPITRDQLLMLEEDNVTAENALTKVFGIMPMGFAEGMRTYLK